MLSCGTLPRAGREDSDRGVNVARLRMTAASVVPLLPKSSAREES